MGTHPSRRACFLFPETHRAPEMGSPGSGAESARPKAHGQNPPFSTLRSPFWAPMRQFFPGRCPHRPGHCWPGTVSPVGAARSLLGDTAMMIGWPTKAQRNAASPCPPPHCQPARKASPAPPPLPMVRLLPWHGWHALGAPRERLLHQLVAKGWVFTFLEI